MVFEAQQLVFWSVDLCFFKNFRAKMMQIMVIYSQIKFTSKGWNNNIKAHKGSFNAVNNFLYFIATIFHKLYPR